MYQSFFNIKKILSLISEILFMSAIIKPYTVIIGIEKFHLTLKFKNDES